MDVSSSDSSAVRPFLSETTGYAVDSRSAATNGDSVAHKIHRERVLLLGWGRAILLQLAHPLVACPIADHSSYHTQRLRRLRRTLHVMLGLTFGGPQQIERVSHAINAVHLRVQGKLRESAGVFPAGTQYSAQNPALLCWVHATSLDSFLCAYELYVGPLSDEEKDRYCAEARAGGPLLGIDQRFLPNNLGELRAYMDRMLDSGEIRVTDTARSLARCSCPSLAAWLAAGVAYAAPDDRIAVIRDPRSLRIPVGQSTSSGAAFVRRIRAWPSACHAFRTPLLALSPHLRSYRNGLPLGLWFCGPGAMHKRHPRSQ